MRFFCHKHSCRPRRAVCGTASAGFIQKPYTLPELKAVIRVLTGNIHGEYMYGKID